jgi:hypothetical protein
MAIANSRLLASAAKSDQMFNDHLRTTSAVIARLMRQASERSHTFQGLVDIINASDGIIYVEEGICAHRRRACFVNVTMAGTHRLLWVKVDTRGIDCDLMGLIGHELQHTVEVLADPHVTDFATMYTFYSREANPGGTFPFETIEATRTGQAVRTEVRQESRCSKIR